MKQYFPGTDQHNDRGDQRPLVHGEDVTNVKLTNSERTATSGLNSQAKRFLELIRDKGDC